MDFYTIRVREIEKGPNKGSMEVYPDFKVGRSKDLMVRSKGFYAIWDDAAKLWSTDEYDVVRLVDEELHAFAKKKEEASGIPHFVKDLHSFNSNVWKQFRTYMQNISDNSHQLDDNLTFANTEAKKSDYVSKRLPYSIADGDYSAWDELVGTLYSVEERAKIEWAFGAIISGDAKKIQKFLVLYGPAGTGKSTVLNIAEKLYTGYTTTFEAKALGANGNAFATEAFKHNPLVAIQHDGDLSKIEDNTKLNSIISHEYMQMNEKYKPSYDARVNAFLLMGTNQPVKITDAKSGIIRRLIDVHPTGVKIPINHYLTLMAKTEFELGAIASRCLDVYRRLGSNYYNGYRPLEMMLQTDVFFNFIEANYELFRSQDCTSLKQAYTLYKEFCSETGIDRVKPQYQVREELRNYFDEFHERGELEGTKVRSFYQGFNANKFKAPAKESGAYSLVMNEEVSLLDELFADQPAQYGTSYETPKSKWDSVKTTLGELDTNRLHFVKVPLNHIVIDFDLKGEDGEKSLEENLKAASSWPTTYAEHSKGGNGVHLHYEYEGDVTELSSLYSEGIEVKTLLGDSSLRRKLTKCNNIPVATFPVGPLPRKEKQVLNDRKIQSEKGLRAMIDRNLKKEIHPHTKSSVDFIKKILDEAYESGVEYDVSDLQNKLITFANNSSNQSLQSLKLVQQMRFKSETAVEPAQPDTPPDDRIVLYDVEVYPNLFVVCWKYRGAPKESIVRMINPSATEIGELLRLKLVGFHNRRYDNHILYARLLGYSNEQLYVLSQRIINNTPNTMFGEAYNLSYADILDFSSKKQSLKKFQVELGLNHLEMAIPWDEPVPEEMWEMVVDYCCNDVYSTEAVFEDRYQDFVARQILADLSGLAINDTTQRHTAKIIFGDDKNPQKRFAYKHLTDEFPGYDYNEFRSPSNPDKNGVTSKSIYRGDNPGEGGYVYAEPGVYENVAVLDVASMHPTSIEILNLFGDEYTPNFAALKAARVAIKRNQFDKARKMLSGKLAPYLKSEEDAEKLSYALKIVINIVYGLTSAKFDNPFRDRRNKDNIVAKRGALFMIDLKHAVQEQGFQVVHIKTDSIKIPNATPEIIKFVNEFGAKYGYDFEHEATYDKFCLVNDAVYIARYGWAEKTRKIGTWDAVGAQFQHPFVYKTLFSGQEIIFRDLCEPKSVLKGAIYMDFQYDNPPPVVDRMQHVGRIGLFVPIREGTGGAMLYRVVEGKPFAVTGTKGYLWLEADMLKELGEDTIGRVDMGYFEGLADKARNAIEKFGSFEEFVA